MAVLLLILFSTLAPVHCIHQQFSYSQKWSNNIYNTIKLVSDEKTLLHLQTGLEEFVKDHPYFADSWQPAHLLKGGETAFDRFMEQDKTARVPTKEQALQATQTQLRNACQFTRTWDRHTLNERCAQNIQDIVCSITDAVQLIASNDKQKDLSKYMWIANLFDSLGKVPSGLALGNLQWLGSYDECKDIRVAVENTNSAGLEPNTMRGKYCKMYVRLRTRGECAEQAVTIGLCVPHTCENEDMNTILANKYLTEITNTSLWCPLEIDCPKEPVVYEDFFMIGVTVFIAIVLLLLIVGTIYDYLVYLPTLNKLPKNHGSMLTQQDNNADLAIMTQREYAESVSMLWKVCLCFSLYTNGSKILSTERREGTMECIHGIRFISMCWVMLGHTYYFAPSFVENPVLMLQVPKEFAFMIINNATVSVDSFFVMSGFLLSFLFLQRMAKSGGAPMKQPQFWIMYYVHRYVRLTPTYMVVIAITYAYWSYIGDGPNYVNVENNELVKNCPSTWWMNALYVNNFQNFTTQCIGWSWYLANDMQFYWVSPIVLVLFYYIPVVAIILCILVMGVSSALRVWVTYNWSLAPNGATLTANPSLWAHAQGLSGTLIYSKPYTRIGPYIVGLLLGYIMFKLKDKCKWNRLYCLLAFCIAITIQWAVIFGPHNYAATGVFPEPWASFYTAFNRVSWAASVALIIFLCVNGLAGPVNSFLSWNLWFPVSRLTYCAYLVHESVLYYIYSTLRKTEYVSHYKAAYTFCAALSVAYMLAFVISVMFEAPVMNLERILFDDRKPPSKNRRATA